MKVEKSVTLEELEMFAIFKIYYRLASANIVDDNIMKHLNEVLNYHYNSVYGNEYNCDKNITDCNFKVIYVIN